MKFIDFVFHLEKLVKEEEQVKLKESRGKEIIIGAEVN